MKKNFHILTVSVSVIFLMGSCRPPGQEDHAVHYRGALRNFMHKNDLSAQLYLDSLRESPNLYGLGARENLRGEILVWDGDPFISLTRDSQVVIDRSFDHRAALFVWARVDRWEAFEVPPEQKDQVELEQFIAAKARELGLDPARAFPFRLEGRAAGLAWHVIDWPPGDSMHTHEKHRTSGPHGRLTDAEVKVLGFYSTAHTGIFTHHTTPMHLHFRTVDEPLAGHVDELLPGRMLLYLPGTTALFYDRE